MMQLRSEPAGRAIAAATAAFAAALLAAAPVAAQKRAAAAAPAASEAASAPDRAELDRSKITGNRELPKVLYIVPWKKPGPGDLAGRPLVSVLDEALSPVDRDVFRRQVHYDAQMQSRAIGAMPTTPAATPVTPAAAATTPAPAPATPAPAPAPVK